MTPRALLTTALLAAALLLCAAAWPARAPAPPPLAPPAAPRLDDTAAPDAAAADSAERDAFLARHCHECHAADPAEGDLRLDLLPRDLADAAARPRWELVLEYVEAGDMPPRDAARHPDAEAVARFVRGLRADLRAADAVAPLGRTGARRLTRAEHLHTLRDLFGFRGIELPLSFPDDLADGAFDTRADALHASPAYLEACLELATDVADRLVPLGGFEPVRSLSVASQWGQGPLAWHKDEDPEGYYLSGVNVAGWSGAIWDSGFVAPASGVYAVRLRANVDRRKGADGRPLRLGFYALRPDAYARPERAVRADLPRVAEVELTNLAPAGVHVRVPLEKGETLHVYCENRLKRTFPERGPNRTQLSRFVKAARASPRPTVRVEAMEISGPVAPLPRRDAFLLDQTPRADADYVGAVLLPLAERAWRRPLTQQESAELVDAVLRHMAEAPDPAHALHYGVRRILCAPQFLYRDAGDGALDGHELATRLAYFLWSSLPDDELLALARDGRLGEPDVLRAQTLRLLDDPRASRFVEQFAAGWLGNRATATVMVCDTRHVWSELIRHGYLRASEMFLAEVLRDDLSIRTFIDSDFTYANVPMQIAWELPGDFPPLIVLEEDQAHSLVWPEPERLDLRALPEGAPPAVAQRGGVLGLPSVLTATGDGVDSSPILRGVWVLENLFGMPTPPPPADVPALVNDVSGALSVREILDAHQASTSCASCHARIDPLGLALEGFDAVGNPREVYALDDGPGPAVDTRARLADGTELRGPAQIKAWLLERPELFTACLGEKLLEHAVGRELNAGDRRVLQAVVDAEPEGGYGLRELLVALVQSEVFASR